MLNGSTGSITNLTISSLRTTADAMLAGGETTIRFNLSQDGISDGLETINISPLIGAIEDNAGNVMSNTEETGDINLNAVNILLITNVTVAADNSFVDVEFSETVERSPSGNAVRYGTNFEFFSINFNDPTADVVFDPALVTITNTSGGAIATTDNVIRFNLAAAITGVATGDETFDIQNRPADRVRGGTSGALLPSGQIIPVTLNDLRSNIVSATYFDTNGDGNINEVVITADDPIDDLTIVLSDFVFEGANPDAITPAVNIENPLDPGTTDDIYVTFDVSITGTATTSTATFAAGNLQNTSAVDYSPNTDIARIDQAAPVIQSATAIDNSTIQLVYGEDINLGTLQFTDGITISGGATVSSVALNGIDNSIVELTVSGLGATDYTGTINLTIDVDDVIEDATGNDVANLSGFAISDGQAPQFVNAFQFDTDGDGNIDEIVIEMSEDFDNATLDVNDFGISAGTISSVSDNGGGTTNTLDDDNDVYFSLEVSVTGTSSVTVDYAEDGFGNALEDVPGNAALDNAAITSIDRAAPAFSFVNPADNATGVTVASVLNEIVFQLSEPATANSGAFINLFRDASPVESIEANDPAVNISGTTVTITLSSNLAKGSSYSVSIDAAAFSDGSSNNSVLDATWNWDMEALGSPNIVGGFPTGTDVPLSSVIRIFFDESVRYANTDESGTNGSFDANVNITVTSGTDANFPRSFSTLSLNTGSEDAGFSPPSNADNNVTINDTITLDLSQSIPAVSFLPNVTYQVSVGDAAFEFAGSSADTQPFTFSFTTVADGTPPTLLGNGIVSFEPDDQADFTNTVNSATTSQLDIIFDENVTAGTGNIQLFLDTNNDNVSDATIFDIATSNPAVTFVAENLASDKLRIDLSALGINLSGGATYFVNVDSDAVLDNSGNAFAGFSDATTWNFTTLTEAVAPGLLTLSPNDNSTNVAIGADFILLFDEAVTVGTTEEVRLFLSSNDQLIETVLASSLSVNNDEVTIDFVNDLSGFTDYYITIQSGAILDLSANPYAGFSNKNTWNFKTESGSDIDSPVVTLIDPVDAATDVPTLPDFSITFNEPVFEGTGNFYVRDGGIVETFDVTTDVSIIGNIVTFSSSTVLNNNTAYTLDWDAGVLTDSEGNGLDIVANQTFISGTTWDFTTIADTEAPMIVTLTPANDATGVTADATFSLVIDFDEAVDLGTGNLEIFYDDGVTLAPSQSFDVSGFILSNSDQTATLTVGPLDGATEYYVSLPSTAFVDEAVPANNVTGINPNGSWSFTTASDVSIPTITNLSPINTATDVDLNGDLLLTFSERVYAGSGSFTITSASQTISINVVDGTQISGFGTNQLTINPNTELFNGELYTVSVDPAAITDASGNNFDPSTLIYSFTTETATDVIAGTATLCQDGPFVTLSDIEINETSIDNFAIGNNQTIILNLPTDFEFDLTSASISAPSGDVTATSIAASTVNSLVITYSVGSIINSDQIVVSGLQVSYTGESALTNVSVFRSGTAELEGNQALQAQPHILLTTNLAPNTPLIEDPAAVGTFLTELAVESLAGNTFDLQVNSAVGTSTYEWENIETNNVFTGDVLDQSNLVADADYSLTSDYLYSFDVTETDLNGCVSPATRFNIFNYDLTLTPDVTAFSEDDDTGTVITISKPANHSASFSGTALGGITIPAVGVAGNAVATFVPSTAGSAGSPYQITYSVTNQNTGESFDFTDGLNFTVSSLVTIFTNTVSTEYCFTTADTNNDIDLDVSITPTNFYFYRIALFDNTGNEVSGAIVPENPTTWQTSGLVLRDIGSLVPVLTQVAGNHFTSDNWILDPSLVPSAGEYEIRYFIIRDGVANTNIPANEIVFRTQSIEIFGLPTVDLTNFTNTVEFFCEDDGLVTIEATVNSSVVTVDGYTITGISDAADGETAFIVGEQIDLSDPVGDGVSYASSTFRISYTSDPADDINGCVNTVQRRLRSLAKPAAPALTSGIDLGTEILFEFCEGEAIPDFQILAPVGNPTEYFWQDNNGTIPTLDTLNEGTSASVFDLFNTANPSPGEYYFTVKRSDFTNNPLIDGCASDLTEITVIIHGQPFIPELDLTASSAGFRSDALTYEFNYCAGDVYEDLILFNDLTPGSPDSAYFWLNENSTLIPSATFADPINLVVTPSELGLDVVDLSSTFDTTFYVTSGEFINTPQFAGCFSFSIAINITIHATPAAPAIGDTSVDFFTEYYACEGDATVTGDGNELLSALRTPQGSDETYNWYEDNDGTGSTPGAFIATANSIPLATLSAATINLDLNTAGVYYFWVTRVTDADASVLFDGCESPATRVAVTVYPTATAPDVTNAQGMVATNFAYAFCEGEITTATAFNIDQTFNAFMGGVGLERSFNWYQSNSSGTITNPTAISVASADGSTATAVELGLVGATAQTRYFLVTHVENIRTDGNFNGCESNGSLIQIDIRDVPLRPTVTGGNIFEYCNGDVVSDISVTGEGNAGEIFTWYDGDGVQVFQGSTATAADLSIVSALPASVVDDSVYTFTVTQTQDIDFNGFTFVGCESPARSFQVIIHPIPVLPIVSVAGSLEICVGEGLPTLSLSNQLPGATLSWRDDMGVEVSTASNFDPVINNSVPSSNTFTVIQIVDNCPSPPTSVTINVNAFPGQPVIVGNTANDLYEFCAESDLSSQTLDISSPELTSTYTWYAGTSTANPLVRGASINFADLDFASASLDINTAGTTTFFVRETNAEGCEGDAKPVEVVINPLPVLSISNLTTQYCFDDAAFTITGLNNGIALSGGTATFSINTGGITDNGDGTAVIDPETAALAAGETREGNQSSHTVTFTYTDNNSCQNVFTFDFVIDPQPVLTIEATTLVACYNDGNIVLQGVVDGVDATGGSFSMDTPAGLTDNGDGTATFSPTLAAIAAGETETGNASTHMVTFALTDGNNCENFTTVTLIVNPRPELDIVLESDNSTTIDGINVCYDDSPIEFRGFADGGAASTGTFVAQFGGLIDNGDGTATFDPELAAIGAGETREGAVSTHNITYTYTDNITNCQNTIVHTVTVSPQPTLEIVYISDNSDIDNTFLCFDAGMIQIRGRVESGGSFVNQIADNISINTGGLTYDPGTGIATIDTEVAAVAAGGTITGNPTSHTITMVYTDALGCSNTISSDITISPKPEVSIRNQDGSALTTSYCVDDSDQTFQAFADNGSVTTGATFTLNGSNLAVNNGQVIISPSSLGDGTYTLEMTYQSDTDPFCENVVSEIITINSLPVLDIVLESDNTTSIDGLNYCYDDAPVIFRGFADGTTAVEGTFSAQFGGLTDNGDGTATFDPEIAAIGAGETREGEVSNHQITFNFTDPLTSCENTVVQNISVSPQPTLDIVYADDNSSVDNTTLCFDEGLIEIRGRVESGGSFVNAVADLISINTGGLTYNASTGIATLDTEAAALAAGGTITGNETDHRITMVYTNGLGCSNTITYDFTISPKPVVSIRNQDGSAFTTSYCVDEPDQTFQAFADNESVTTGVTFTLDGVNLAVNNGQVIISPATRGAGTYVLEMTYVSDVDPFCENVVSETITINALPDVDIVLESDNTTSIDGTGYCYDDDPIIFRGLVDNVAVNEGTFTGRGITDNGDGTATFDPELAANTVGQGREGDPTTHEITFTYTNPATNCENFVTYTLGVSPQPTLDIVYLSNSNTIENSRVCFDEGLVQIRGRVEIGGGFQNRIADSFTISSAGLTYDASTGIATLDTEAAATALGETATGNESVHTITMAYTNPLGCTNTISHNITISPKPEIEIRNAGSLNLTTNFCESDPDQIFQAVANNANATTNVTFTIDGNPLAVSQGRATFSPSALGVGTYLLEMVYTDVNDPFCENVISETIVVNPIPIAVPVVDGPETFEISVDKACQEEEAILSIDIDNVDPANLQYQWSDNNGVITGATASTYVDNLANSPGLRDRQYRVLVTNTLTNCSVEFSRNVSFGVKPNPKFKWDFITEDFPTTFTFKDEEISRSSELENIEFYLVNDAGAVNDTIFKSDPFLNIDLINTSTLDITIDDPGNYEATMVINTINGCSRTIVRRVDIVPFVQVENDVSYSATFDSDEQGWFTDFVNVTDRFEDTSVNSWEYGLPQNTVIGQSDQGGNAWVTGLTSNYNNDELSYLYSPSFDISAVERPTISFERNLDFDSNDDGAILQFTLDGGLTWSNVGNVTDDNSDNILEPSGINWYNNLSVRSFLRDPSNPGAVGWTTEGNDNDGEWLISRHKLDLLDETTDRIRFRFVIASNADDAQKEGIGIDNFRIFNRDRLSVIETFSTLLSETSRNANELTFDVLNDPTLLLSDVIWLNYFNDFDNSQNTNSRAVDPLNDRNKIAPGAVSTLYGINRAPRAVINGMVQEEISTNLGANPDNFDLLGWSENDLSISSLTEPLVEISLTERITEQDEINLDVSVVANVDFLRNTELTTRIFIVESQIDPEDVNADLDPDDQISTPVYNVVREMLPDPDGFNFVGTASTGETIGEYSVRWQVSDTYHPDRLKAVVYVQDEGIISDNNGDASLSESIFQVAELDLAPKTNVITGIERQFLLGEEFALYPNPASDQVNVVFNKPVKNLTIYNLVDQTGKVLQEGELPIGTKEFPINTEKLAGGVYFVNVMDENVTLKPRRLIIIPR